MEFRTTADIPVPDCLLDQVIGQDEGVAAVRLAAGQRRFLLLVGEPGTGKSLLASALSELLPAGGLQDLVVFPGAEDKNLPEVRALPAGTGEAAVRAARAERRRAEASAQFVYAVALVATAFLSLWLAAKNKSFVYLVGGLVVGMLVVLLRRLIRPAAAIPVPKLLVSNAQRAAAPFVDATGAHMGALLGDVRHDPFQSGGVETPPHELIEAGAVHRAHRGVLFVDEVSTLEMESQQSLLTAIQEKTLPITGRSAGSSGAMVRTGPVPCDFVLALAGNLQDVEKMHPALRSRLRGYGYEVHVKSDMADTPENRDRLARFVAQEVRRDGKIPHFTSAAVAEVVAEARRRAGREGRLTLRLRELGGLVRAAGDRARGRAAAGTNPAPVEADDVRAARWTVRPLEEQMARDAIAASKGLVTAPPEGERVGRAHGTALLGGATAVLVAFGAEATRATAPGSGACRVVGAGDAGSERRHLDALVAARTALVASGNAEIADLDLLAQPLYAQPGLDESGNGLAIAVALVSALRRLPVEQSQVFLGDVTLHGDVLPAARAAERVRAAAELGVRRIVAAAANEDEILLDPAERARTRVTLVSTLAEALAAAVGVQSPNEVQSPGSKVQGPKSAAGRTG
ncbi:MAG: ATP-dependent protease LonB [Planctomycetes bacterium]|nr:ATP-dependent protease LonB [Planctomycetota bacterium]